MTGGIATGKSAVSDRFARLGVPIIDTDRIAHAIVEPGQPALQEIVRTFGTACLDEGGHLDRRAMRKVIFADAGARLRLEAILHPVIAREALRQVREASYPYCILVIPLYTESPRWSWIDRVLVVDAEETTQLERVMRRDRIDRTQAEAILAAQTRRRERLALADDIIDNGGDLAALDDQVATLHRKYLELAGSRP